jgi:hypothetical protein
LLTEWNVPMTPRFKSENTPSTVFVVMSVPARRTRDRGA